MHDLGNIAELRVDEKLSYLVDCYKAENAEVRSAQIAEF